MIKNNTYMRHALRIAVGITMMAFLLASIGLVQAETQTPLHPELGIPDAFQMPGRLEANGTHFELNNSEYLNITLDSSEPINLTLESAPEMVTMHIESAAGATSTQIILGGFLPHTTYHKYEDNYHNHTAFTVDVNGNYSYIQDLSIPHLVFIQPRPSTKFINDNTTGGDCTSFGTWDVNNKICTLTDDVNQTIEIDSNGITLDGKGHTLNGSNIGNGNGIYLYGISKTTIKNITIKSFNTGIYLDSANNNSLNGTNATNNYYGIQINGNNNSLSYNEVSRNNYIGIQINGNNNSLSYNDVSRNTIYFYIGPCGIEINGNNNSLSYNDVSRNNYNGIEINGINNTLSYNDVTYNRQIGIFLYNTDHDLLIGNNASSNGQGLSLWNTRLMKLRNNKLVANSFNFNQMTSSYDNDIDVSNLVDGKPIYYIKNVKDTVFDSSTNAGTFLCENCLNVTIKDMSLNKNGAGVVFINTSNSKIQNVSVSNNQRGIELYQRSNKNNLSYNTASNNYKGIILDGGSSNNKLNYNKVLKNSDWGIEITYLSNNNTLSYNNVSNHNIYEGYGIYVHSWSNNNILNQNNISNNYYGIKINDQSDYNIIYNNNFINNAKYNANDTCINQWYNGYPSGGNYWGDYISSDLKSGINQDQLGSDGIGDTPYPIPGGSNMDRYPLMAPYTGEPPTLVNHAPNQPSELYQNKSDGTTPIATGTATNERTVIFKGRVSDPDGDNVKLQVELRRTDEYNGEFNESKGGLKESELVTNGSIATASAIELINGNYHWRARTVDEHGNKSEWKDFGGNLVSEVDFTVSQSFRFVQITDVHIGPHIEDCFPKYDSDQSTENWEKTCGQLWQQSIDKFEGTLEKIKSDNPDFVIVTGDIVEWNNPNLYRDFNNLISQLTMAVYVVPGNHDRRGIENPTNDLEAGRFCIDGIDSRYCSDNYAIFVGSDDPNRVTGDYVLGRNYHFDKFGYRFIGLDSGYDPSNLLDLLYIDPGLLYEPTGSGLSPEQVNYVRDNALYDKTIVFMHHPTNDFNLNHNVIKENREAFINAELYVNAKLTLTGHTHDFRHFDNRKSATGWAQTYVAQNSGLFVQKTASNLLVQTRSASEGYTIIDVSPNDDKEILIRDVRFSGIAHKILSVHSPADLHVYDEFGRHTGINITGGIDNQIPNSYYIRSAKIGNITLPESVILYNTTLNYSTEIISNFSKENIITEQSHFNITIEETTGGAIKTTNYNNVIIEANSRAYIEANGSQNNYSMQVDLNNDSTIETVKTPDTVTTDYAPTAVITSPANGTVWDQGQPITFSGTGSDLEDGTLNELAWISDRDDVIGYGNFINSNLSAGVHRITLHVNDSIGQVNISSIVLTVRDMMPPNLEIDYPMENKTFNNPNVNVKGIAYDDSGISNVTVNGIQAGKESWNASIGLSEGENRIEVTATDNKGFSKTANRTVYYNSTLASDTQPPAIVTNLTHETGYDRVTGAWINWTWDNPKDQDFSYAIIYLDNIPMGNTSRSYFNFTGLSNDADYNISILTADIVDNINYSEVKDTARTLFLDTTPPASVKNLVNVSYAQNYINWTWTEPIDPDFAKVMVYLNGVYKIDVLKGVPYYNATVTPGTYTIGTRTVDTNGTINATMVTHTATTILPPIRFINGTVIDSVNKTGISGVTVSANSTLLTATNLSGFYSFAVTSGTYNLTAKFEPTYYVNNTIMVSTVLSAVVVQDIELVRKPTGNITGSVTKV